MLHHFLPILFFHVITNFFLSLDKSSCPYQWLFKVDLEYFRSKLMLRSRSNIPLTNGQLPPSFHWTLSDSVWPVAEWLTFRVVFTSWPGQAHFLVAIGIAWLKLAGRQQRWTLTGDEVTRWRLCRKLLSANVTSCKHGCDCTLITQVGAFCHADYRNARKLLGIETINLSSLTTARPWRHRRLRFLTLRQSWKAGGLSSRYQPVVFLFK